jgi:hypothetical protein
LKPGPPYRFLPKGPILPGEIGPKTELVLVVTLTLVGLWLRLVGVSYGLPDDLYHPDTPKQLHRVPRFLNGELIPRDTYPTLHMYLVALVLWGLGFLDPHSVGVGPSLTRVVITTRLLNALLGAGIIPLVYVAGKWLLGWPVAAFAATLASVSALHVLHAHYEMGDIAHTFFVMASFAASVRVFLTGRPVSFLLAGAFAGLAASAKYYGAIVFGALVVSALTGAPIRKGRARTLLACAATIAIAVFVLTTPKLLLTPLGFAESMRHSKELFTTETVRQPPPWQRPVVAGKILIGMSQDWFGTPMLGLAVLGAGWVLPRHPGGYLLLTPPILIVALYVAARSNYLDDRNLVILAPFVSLMAAAAVVWLRSRSRLVASAAAALGFVVFVLASVESLNVAYLFSQDDTRRFAKRWVKQHVPPSAKIVERAYHETLEGYQGTNADLLLLNSHDYRRHVVWYTPRPSERARHALEVLEERGKLLKRFELLHRGFTAPTLSYYDLDSMAVPFAFPPPDDVAPLLPESLVFLDPEAVPDHVGVLLEPGQSAARTLASREPVREVAVVLSGVGRVRVRQGPSRARATLEPGRPHVVFLRPWRTFPWFKYFYPITVRAKDGVVYARILSTPCDIAQRLVADRQWVRAVPYLEACKGASWTEPARLLDLAWAYAQMGQVSEAERAIEALRRVAPGLLDVLSELVGQPDGDSWRERYRALTGHGWWFWHSHTFTIQAEDAPEPVGIIATNHDADGGKVVVAERGKTAPGYLRVRFPQHFLKGRYLVRFRIRQTAAGAPPAATLSVVRHFQNRAYDIPVSRDWSGASLEEQYQEVVLPVATDLEPIKIEARVFYHGRGSLEVDAISIVPDIRSALAAKIETLRGIRGGVVSQDHAPPEAR